MHTFHQAKCFHEKLKVIEGHSLHSKPWNVLAQPHWREACISEGRVCESQTYWPNPPIFLSGSVTGNEPLYLIRPFIFTTRGNCWVHITVGSLPCGRDDPPHLLGITFLSMYQSNDYPSNLKQTCYVRWDEDGYASQHPSASWHDS